MAPLTPDQITTLRSFAKDDGAFRCNKAAATSLAEALTAALALLEDDGHVPPENELDAEGLWRKAVKGARGATPHPGSMTEFLTGEPLRRLPVMQDEEPCCCEA